MTVYVLCKGYDYEGEDVLGVFASIDAAEAAMRRDAEGYDRGTLERGRDHAGNVSWPFPGGWYTAYPFEVVG